MRATSHQPARLLGAVLLSATLLAAGCAASPTPSPGAPGSEPEPMAAAVHDGSHHSAHHGSISRPDRAKAQLANAAFQDVTRAEAEGWKSSLQTLGCFQEPTQGGMGVHYINDALLDDKVDITKPEALVYELDAQGAVTGLVAHEYIVPVDAWTKKKPPRLFGVAFHQHPTLPLYVLHAWLWKDNVRGDFDDWNPAVRQCPPGVPIFGQAGASHRDDQHELTSRVPQ